MYEAVHRRIGEADLFIGAAAVADYQAADVSRGKIKKSTEELSIRLTRNPDILASVANLADRPFTVGFAAETGNLREYALGKLEQKNLDMIVANLVGDGRGFESDRNAVEVYWKGGEQSLPDNDKMSLARDLAELIGNRFETTLQDETKPELPTIAVRD
jgi:phosphopantothenoylcysteine decarboxylase/phosphopantothenate--cysteine ligase